MRVSLCAASISLGAVVVITGASAGATASALVREGDDLGSQGIVSSISNSAANHVFGWAFTLNTDRGGETLSHVFGNASGGMGSILRSESTIGSFDQTSFESFFGISDAGMIAYSPLSNNIDTGLTGIDGVWVDGTPIMNEEEPAGGGLFWTFGSRPGITADGQPYWVGGTSTTQGGSTQVRGIYFGNAATPVLLGGTMAPGLPAPIGDTGIDFDYRFSSLGTNYITPVNMDLSSTVDGAIVVNGSGYTAGGTLVREGNLIPASVGGIGGENWDNFDFVGITEAGDVMITGDTDGDIGTDEFIYKNGQFLYREGDVVGGRTLLGNIEGSYMNESGDIGYIWSVAEGTGDIEALYLNDQLLLLEGDNVDWDGDGTVDANAVLENFTGISALTISERNANGEVTLYFTADVDVDGQTLEGAFAVTALIPGPGGLGLLLMGGLLGRRRRR